MPEQRIIDMPQGPIAYRDSGRGEAIVFVHGLLVNGLLWRNVTPALDKDFRCVVPDLPLGSHAHPLGDGADRSPRGIAHLVADFIEALELERVTLVGNDTGGAICQLLASERPERLARLVLTNCDCYENFLPPAFRPMQWLAHVPGALAAGLQPMRIKAIRRSPLGFGLLTRRPIPEKILDAYLGPPLRDRRVRRDAVELLKRIDKKDTLQAAERLKSFEHPALIAWAPEDPFFKLRFAERLASDIPQARLEQIPDCRTFVPEDQPQRLAELIAAFVREPVPA